MGDFALAVGMMKLARDKATGILEVDAGIKHTLIEWIAGRPVFANESAPTEPLGRLLVRQGRLTSGQYELTMKHFEQRSEVDPKLRFGEAVVELGLLSSEQVQRALVDQLRWRIIRSIQLEDPIWTFKTAPPTEDPTAVFPFAVEPLILTATRWIDPARLDRFLAPNLGDKPRLATTATKVRALLELEEVEGAFVAGLDGGRSIQALLHEFDAKLDVRALITTLAVTGGCMPLGAPSAPELTDAAKAAAVTTPLARPTTPLIAIPEAPPSASVLSRMAKTKNLARRLAPQTPHRPMLIMGRSSARLPPDPEPFAGTPSPSTKLPVAEPAAAAPIPILRKTPPPRSRTDPRISADRAFEAGKKMLFADNLEQAQVEFRRAAELLEGLAEYRLYALWLDWVRGSTGAEHVAALTATARETIVQDPNLAFPRYVLGRLALAAGDAKHAKPLFQFAVKLDATLLDAQRYVRLMERRERDGTAGTANDLFEPRTESTAPPAAVGSRSEAPARKPPGESPPATTAPSRRPPAPPAPSPPPAPTVRGNRRGMVLVAACVVVLAAAYGAMRLLGYV